MGCKLFFFKETIEWILWGIFMDGPVGKPAGNLKKIETNQGGATDFLF